jgi:hypothetical protein
MILLSLIVVEEEKQITIYGRKRDGLKYLKENGRGRIKRFFSMQEGEKMIDRLKTENPGYDFIPGGDYGIWGGVILIFPWTIY